MALLVWKEEGPGPLALPMGGYSKAAGAIQAIATDRTDPERVFVATVGGGIWGSLNAASGSPPSWKPLTDFASSLSMSAIAISPLDKHVLYAGCGGTSHSDPIFGSRVGRLLGILMSTDDGSTWVELARNVFQGLSVMRILPMPLSTPTGQVVLVATWGGGLLRSEDGGQTWQKIGVIDNYVTDVVVTPNNPNEVYVAGPKGIFRSDDGGKANWNNISAGLGSIPGGASIKLSISLVQTAAGQDSLFAAMNTGAYGFALFITQDRGQTWSQMGNPPDGSKPSPPLCASPLTPNVVFCTSDSGSHWMVIANQGTTPPQWQQVDFQGASGTAPHTDGRDCAFSASPHIMFDTNDGGIYRLLNPHGIPHVIPRHWEEAVGNIRIAEFHSIAYDSINHIIFGATQDNSIPQQTAPHDKNWGLNEDSYGDGFEVGVDNSSTEGASVHYSSQQNLFRFRRRTYTSPTQVTADEALSVIINGTGGLGYNVVEGALTPNDPNDLGTIRWNQTWAVNAADGQRLLLGTDYLYESFDRGDHFDSLGGLSNNSKGEWIPQNPVGRVSAYAYGHVNNPDVIYVGAGGKLLLRTGASGLPTVIGSRNPSDRTDPGTYTGSSPIGIVLDRDDWRRAYILDSQGRVWRTVDAGATATSWVELTGNLPMLCSDLRSIALFIPPTYWYGQEAIFVGGLGGVYVCQYPGNGPGNWGQMGFNFPNAIVTDLHYCAKDDLLIAGTLGRSCWSLSHALKMFELELPNFGIINYLIGSLADGPLYTVSGHGIKPVPPRGPDDAFREKLDKEIRRAMGEVAQGLKRLQALNREYEQHEAKTEREVLEMLRSTAGSPRKDVVEFKQWHTGEQVTGKSKNQER